VALGAAAATVWGAGIEPTAHAYDATLWLIAAYVVQHAAIAGLMTAYLAFRVAAGYASPQRIGEVRILRLWSDYAASTGLVAFAAAWTPGVLA
jgi:cytochrome c oxidase subunit I+III